jgi:hypothetical protein
MHPYSAACLTVLPLLLASSTNGQCVTETDGPMCGAFISGIIATPPAKDGAGADAACSVVKISYVGGVEYNVALPRSADVCSDAGTVDAAQPVGPVTGQDKGNLAHGSGNGSYLFYTSGSGRFVHQIFMDKSNEAPKVSHRAALPTTYDPILGLTQLVHPGPLYVVTQTELYSAPALDRFGKVVAAEPIASLESLNLSVATKVAAAAASSTVYALDGWTLHALALARSPSGGGENCTVTTTRLAPPPGLAAASARALGSVDDQGLLLILLDSHDLAAVDPASGAVAVVNASLSPGGLHLGAFSMGAGSTLYYLDDAPSFNTVYVDLDDMTGESL